ncbi:hypothetical protein AALB53_11215 [Lachnospiraceae bacterium 47-T17]
MYMEFFEVCPKSKGNDRFEKKKYDGCMLPLPPLPINRTRAGTVMPAKIFLIAYFY